MTGIGTTGASRNGLARLDELAEVTREYARYSRTAHGIASAAFGFVLIGTLALDLIAHSPWAGPAYVLLAPVWLGFVVVARAYYQRHGTVVEPESGPRRWWWEVAVVWLLAAVLASNIAVVTRGWGLGSAGDWATFVAIAGLVAVPALYVSTRGALDTSLAVVLLVWAQTGALASGSGESSLLAETGRHVAEARSMVRLAVGLLALAPLAVSLLVQGTREHVRYARLERRLAALKARS